jgi:hypothetical protein
MLGSITPLGERGRKARWGVTVTAFALGSALAGAALGGLLGAAGSVLFRLVHIPGPARLGALLALVAAGLAFDLRVLGLRLPTVRRQVNEQWLHRYRGWVYGLGFGVQLGLGFATVVTISAVYLTFGSALLSASVLGGALVGGSFGLIRAAPVLTLGRVRGTGRMGAVDARLRSWDRRSRRVALAAEFALAVVSFVLLVS